ncbi:MAG: type II methionyl aminopeptidase [Candidatus Aenigmarchaeota archaeon ex4484_56]|nr:MAG: type II methionyl aminopeptidase [Candidatus Aenigmarchaeota archaeon ex4484_56]
MVIEKYKKAGEIAKTVREEGKKLVKPGTKIIDIAEKIESRIKELGGEIAFPVNIGINDIAAHYSPSKDDDIVINENDVVKLDIGVSIDGYIADTASTVFLSEEDRVLVEATDKALEEAIKLVRPGVDVNDISAKIEEIIKSYNLNPIVNLTGHGLDQYLIHTEPKIPNYKSNYSYILKEGDVIAIEPFATYGRNYVKEEGEDRGVTFSLIAQKPCRLRESKDIIKQMISRKSMPFSDRWINISGIKLKLAIKELIDRECIEVYRILRGDSKISQSEHTLIVFDKPLVISE